MEFPWQLDGNSQSEHGRGGKTQAKRDALYSKAISSHIQKTGGKKHSEHGGKSGQLSVRAHWPTFTDLVHFLTSVQGLQQRGLTLHPG